MGEKQSGGESSNPERDEALRGVRHISMVEPLSEEEFKQWREESRRREEEDKHLPVYDPVAAERMAYEMNPLTRADERFRVQDPVEAEHMAHAMDPHYERASAIDALKSQTDETLGHVTQEDDALTRKESLEESDALQGVEGSEILDWADRAAMCTTNQLPSETQHLLHARPATPTVSRYQRRIGGTRRNPTTPD